VHDENHITEPLRWAANCRTVGARISIARSGGGARDLEGESMPGQAQAESTTAGAQVRRPSEAVLPRIGYALLLLEAAALAAYYATHKVAPGDRVGHAIGWAGTGSMVLMHVYSLRRRVRALSGWGRLSAWLRLHIFLGLQGALLVTFHSLHLSQLANFSGATIVLTLIVVASGSLGRYLYSWLPRSLTGERLSAREIEAELAALQPLVAAGAVEHADVAGAAAALERMPALTGRMSLWGLIGEDRRTRRGLAALDRALANARRAPHGPELAGYAAALRRRAALTRRLAALTAAERMFRNWHLFHKPLTIVLLGAVVLHVVTHYIYGFSG
jgi:hypothetical protein